MKIKIYKKIAVTLAIAMVFTACSDSFLEQTNPNEPTTDTFWKTTGDLYYGVVSIYNALKEDNVLLIKDETYRSDLSWPGFGRPTTDNVAYLQIFNNSYAPSNLKWGALYRGVFRANQVIAAYERIAPTLTKDTDIAAAKVMYAEAKALRGLFYFYLYNCFNNGSVPLFDSVPQSANEYNKPLSPAETVKAFYLADFEDSKDILPISWSAASKGRITSGAVYAMLGQSYLYEKDYVKAAELFKKVITNFGFALTTDIGSNFTSRDEHNSESILEVNYATEYKSGISVNDIQQVSSAIGGQFASGSVGGFRTVLPSSWLTMLYKNEKLDQTDLRNIAKAADGTIKARKYSLRASQSIALVDDEFTPYYLSATPADATPFNNSETSYFRKYSNWDIVANEKQVATSFFRSGINVRIIRLADIYLLYAESLIKGGTDNSALDQALLYVNKVRRRSAVQLLGPIGSGEYPTNDHDDITYTAQSLMNHLMYIERPLELAIEGNATRTIDMRRWGITKTRMQELSTRRYYATDYIFKSSTTGQNVTRFTSVLHDLSESPTKPINANFNEFGNSVKNFDANIHSYWPIPSSELTSNTALITN
ncbi:hypothetical protein FFWV33_15375 [Flavobacterium faecale]|uniref:RagB/SusD family nutrient uptake outer membrane protein n=1 Tax=Flavobacterium faecale TaxID=1355330 RepID=A0A2S1LGA0_9FLAO|nr:RagB/SusD family nutrient uptake outer membrane protein [Flavobacterium faecale]AWG22810.1 hypothetical protein FFWV33_15375 [Flavobacterium faecale]